VLFSLSGGELFDRVADDNYKMTEQEVVKYMRQICDAVSHMHERSVVHLDLKPENIMCETSCSTNIRIIDFGLAANLNPNEPVRLTNATLEFAAPEVVDQEPIGFYTDMWAVGVLAYVLYEYSSSQRFAKSPLSTFVLPDDRICGY
jgi:serine/threonine protein kinase